MATKQRTSNNLKISRSGSSLVSPADAPYARFCKLVEAKSTSTNKGNRVTWDEAKLKCSLSEEELADELMLKNITQGYIVSGGILPLIFDKTLPDSPAHFRSIPFFKKVVADSSLISSLDDDQKASFVVGVRDLWFAGLWGLLDKTEQSLLDKLVNVFEDDACPYAELQSLSFSLAPTNNRRVLRYIEHLEEVDEDFVQLAAKLKVGDQSLYAVWVDGRELSYHNFECILPLDRALHKEGPLDIQLKGFKRKGNLNVYVGKVTGKDVELLSKLDDLGLYQQPSNSSTRGGERFIFSSPTLSKQLTTAVWDSGVLDLLPPKIIEEEKEAKEAVAPRRKSLRQNKKQDDEVEKKKVMKYDFVTVNSVFRCNRFAPGSSKFKLHMDTPYYDALNHHVSKYTIIIYLSGGEGTPALLIGGGEDGSKAGAVSIDKLEDMQCVIFDQKYEHEGSSYLKGNKVFLRSELIFKQDKKESKPEIANLFSSAIYYTAQSMFQPEYSQHAHELYERVNKAHWGLDKNEKQMQVQFLHKNWDDKVHFATNGYDYYFPYCAGDKEKENDEGALLALKTYALIAVLDYFNCKTAEKEEESEENDEEEQKDDGKKRKTKPTKKVVKKKAKKAKVETAFRKNCKTSALPPAPKDAAISEHVMAYLWDKASSVKGAANPFEVISAEEKEKVVTKKKYTPVAREITDEMREEDGREADDDEPPCCPFHCFHTYDPTAGEEVMDVFKKAREYATSQLLAAPLVYLGKKIQVDPSAILVEDSKLFINSANRLKEPIRVNFAACWNGIDPGSFLGVGGKVEAPRLLLPPVPYRIVPAKNGAGPGFHLMLDFFNNDWIVPLADLDRAIPIPKLFKMEELEEQDDLEGYSEYLNTVNPEPRNGFSYHDHWSIHAAESDDSDFER